MLKITGYISVPTLDVEKFKKDLDAHVTSLMHKAAREFVETAVKNIPVDTGMAVGAMIPLGRFVGATTQVAPKRPYRLETDYVRTHELGQVKSMFAFKSVNFIYEFVWRSWVFHHWLNEQFSIKTVSSSPWHSIPLGLASALSYIRENFHEVLPNVSTSLNWRKHRLG
jgi:hypothetical protein